MRGRDRQAYGYQYDFLDRLTQATYGEITDAGSYDNKDRYNSTVQLRPSREYDEPYSQGLITKWDL